MLDVDRAGAGLPRYFVDVTCATDGRTHHVDELLLSDGSSSGSGRIEALCGRFVVAASMAEPPGPGCQLCRAARVRRSAR